MAADDGGKAHSTEVRPSNVPKRPYKGRGARVPIPRPGHPAPIHETRARARSNRSFLPHPSDPYASSASANSSVPKHPALSF